MSFRERGRGRGYDGSRHDDRRSGSGSRHRGVGGGVNNNTKWNMMNRQQLASVQTNCFPIYFSGNANEKQQSSSFEWHEYDVTIYRLKRSVIRDEQGNVVKDEFAVKTRRNLEGELKPVTISCERSSGETRQIIKTLQTAHEKDLMFLVTDGSEKAYSPVPLKTLEYQVKAPRQEVDENDPDKDYIKVQHVKVVFKYLVTIDFGVQGSRIVDPNQKVQFQKIQAIVNVALRRGLLQALKAYKRAFKNFFLPLHYQEMERIVGREIAKPVYGAYDPKAAMGIKASATVTQNGQLLFAPDLVRIVKCLFSFMSSWVTNDFCLDRLRDRCFRMGANPKKGYPREYRFFPRGMGRLWASNSPPWIKRYLKITEKKLSAD